MSKEAVVFLLDAHPSMNAPYPSNSENGSKTRLSCAKEAIEGMVSQLMIQSKQNEVGVIVLNTDPTVKAEEGFEDDDDDHNNPHMTSLAFPAVTRPTVELLQAIRRVECAKTDHSGADVCRGMSMAEKALRHRTFKKKYARRLVVFTDAAHRVESPNEVILRVIDNLRELECTLTVIGVDFENSAKFEEPLAEDKAAVKNEGNGEDNDDDAKMAAADDSDATDNESEGEEEESDDEEEDDMQNIKNQNEQLLISVARLTGGSIIAASTMKEIADSALGKKIPKSTKKKIKFNIAPGISLDARCSLLLSKASFPSLKKEAVALDKQDKPKVDGNGDIMTHPVKTFTDHYNADSQDEEVSESNRTHGYRYGADCIPMSSVDTEGIRLSRSDPALTIKGYVDQSTIPRAFLLGPPYAVFGHDSHRVCCAIASLAQALHQTSKVAICTYFKSKTSDPILCALYPLQENGKSEQPTRLFFMQLPFADDKRPYNLPRLEPGEADSAESRACDDLIDAMMLPSDALQSNKIANPSIRSFHKTVKSRAVDPSFTEIVTAREEPSVDCMSTPADVLMGASAALETFGKTFPREKVAEEETKGKKKKKYWTEHED